MRVARFSLEGNVGFGVLDTDQDRDEPVLDVVRGHPFGGVERSGRHIPLKAVRLLPPVLPNKVVAVGRNYAEHARELGNEVPETPVIFLKPSTSVVGPDDPVPYPSFSREVHHEAELAVVIGRMCREVPPSRAAEVILGYTCANDITARDIQRSEEQWTRAKGFDGSCPLGPWVETEITPERAADLAIMCTVNGEQRQLGRTDEMVRGIPELIAHITEAMTLLPGDVILTGTPAGVGPLEIGDEVAVTIEGIGTLTNKVVKRD
ncbi:DUF2437 domain-containing protein [Streptomyces alkaliphilus]|uniref:DUF2437 domain-containing protein n=1 Tax=Streptomyces alkaliphilus TaxID=1472722 RepID=A0A7W3Y0M5_9ACTN|nr:fumarylacetoacetate hydrolase family protein [Streptomyces alkaliphilus]MBB0243819.1 DUF2437 domain-containing protein [Streptomyces alkaliphilus]